MIIFMKKLFLTLTLILGVSFAPALHAQDAAETTPVIVEVRGMICDFCAHAIMKVFNKEVGLPEDNISISLEKQEVTIEVPNDMEITDAQIEKFIHYSGYDFVAIRR